MSMYVEQNLGKGETIVAKVKLDSGGMIFSWILTGLFLVLILASSNDVLRGLSVILFFIGCFFAISRTISFFTTELAVTNKKLIGKMGLINTRSMDAPLNKIQNVSVSSGLLGKISGCGDIKISTASGIFSYRNVKRADDFKAVVMAQIDLYEEQEAQKRAQEMARAMVAAQQVSKSGF